MSAPRLIISAGGTGGHIFPGIAVAQQWVADGGEVLFVGARGGMEERVVPAAGFTLETIKASPLKGMALKDRARGAASLPAGLWATTSILRSFRPSVVLGMGGYASFATCAAASVLRIPLVLCEQNSIPGLANRVLARSADRVCTSFLNSVSYFPRAKVRHTGNPISRRLVEASLGRSPIRALERISVLGGSGGAGFLNQTLASAVAQFAARNQEIEILFQTGRGREAEVTLDLPSNLKVTGFVDDMPGLLARSSLYIGRSGAGAVFEVCAMALPSILIPFPGAADQHQEHNARVLANAEAGVLLTQDSYQGDRFLELLEDLKRRPERLAAMSAAARRLARPEAAAAVVEVLKGVCR
jgi:UDP-N-acetylglucosamine--N-acetylmuramyl-(pentapeptide) pyrophosphoryl-undecaprenol N-acetylglucosamine transferase